MVKGGKGWREEGEGEEEENVMQSKVWYEKVR